MERTPDANARRWRRGAWLTLLVLAIPSCATPDRESWPVRRLPITNVDDVEQGDWRSLASGAGLPGVDFVQELDAAGVRYLVMTSMGWTLFVAAADLGRARVIARGRGIEPWW